MSRNFEEVLTIHVLKMYFLLHTHLLSRIKAKATWACQFTSYILWNYVHLGQRVPSSCEKVLSDAVWRGNRWAERQVSGFRR